MPDTSKACSIPTFKLQTERGPGSGQGCSFLASARHDLELLHVSINPGKYPVWQLFGVYSQLARAYDRTNGLVQAFLAKKDACCTKRVRDCASTRVSITPILSATSRTLKVLVLNISHDWRHWSTCAGCTVTLNEFKDGQLREWGAGIRIDLYLSPLTCYSHI